jgi:hypothetical protein
MACSRKHFVYSPDCFIATLALSLLSSYSVYLATGPTDVHVHETSAAFTFTQGGPPISRQALRLLLIFYNNFSRFFWQLQSLCRHRRRKVNKARTRPQSQSKSFQFTAPAPVYTHLNPSYCTLFKAAQPPRGACQFSLRAVLPS